MRIAILTPLFPPDVGEPAPYAKLLAKKLSEAEHDVSVLLYGHLPENVDGVKFVCTDKRKWTFVRLYLYTMRLLMKQSKYDLLIINNGLSTEFPATYVTPFKKSSTILVVSDPIAKAKSQTGMYKNIHENLKKKAIATLDVTNAPDRHKPEIHPFKPVSEITQDNHDKWWNRHLEEILSYAK